MTYRELIKKISRNYRLMDSLDAYRYNIHYVKAYDIINGMTFMQMCKAFQYNCTLAEEHKNIKVILRTCYKCAERFQYVGLGGYVGDNYYCGSCYQDYIEMDDIDRQEEKVSGVY